MASQSSKRKKDSPIKGQDKCSACAVALDPNSSALECDSCENWLCIKCLEMPLAEYNLFTKMTRRIGCQWVCPVCKLRAPQSSNQSNIGNQVKTLLFEFEDRITKKFDDSFDLFKDSITKEISEAVNPLSDRISNIERDMASKCSVADVDSRISKLVAEGKVGTDLEDQVLKVMRQDRDRQRRKLNLIAYGVSPTDDDTNFVIQHLASDYSLPGVKILNLKRLGANNPPTQQVPDRPPPILFSVTDIATKVKILKKSVELKADIQFHSDESREDRAKRKSATEELKRRIANGETDLGVRNGKVVSKNGQRAPPPALGAMEH